MSRCNNVHSVITTFLTTPRILLTISTSRQQQWFNKLGSLFENVDLVVLLLSWGVCYISITLFNIVIQNKWWNIKWYPDKAYNLGISRLDSNVYKCAGKFSKYQFSKLWPIVWFNIKHIENKSYQQRQKHPVRNLLTTHVWLTRDHVSFYFGASLFKTFYRCKYISWINRSV